MLTVQLAFSSFLSEEGSCTVRSGQKGQAGVDRQVSAAAPASTGWVLPASQACTKSTYRLHVPSTLTTSAETGQSLQVGLP